MSRKLVFSASFLALLSVGMGVSAQPVAPPPKPEARDREPHYRSKPQSQFPRTNRPNLNILADESIPPASEEDDDVAPVKPSDIKSTISTPRVRTDASRTGSVRTEVRGIQSDLVLATSVGLQNRMEILSSEFAITKAQNVEVQRYAKLMVHDHGVFLKKLQVFAPELARPAFFESVAVPLGPTPLPTVPVIDRTTAVPPTAIERAAFKTSVELPDRSRMRRGDSLMTVAQMMNIERDLAAQALGSHKEILAAKTGLDFDETYVGQQLAMQLAIKNRLIVYERYASPELSPLLSEGRAMAEEHFNRALGLMSTLDADSNPIPSADNRIKIKPRVELPE